MEMTWATLSIPLIRAAIRMECFWKQKTVMSDGRRRSNILQPFLNVRSFPEKTLRILHPFEVRHDHATGVGQDVWNDKDPLVLQHAIGLQCRWTVRSFGENPAAQFRGIAFGDLLG